VYTVEVVDVLRPNPFLTLPLLDVFRFGGDIDQGGHVTSKIERGFPRFADAHQYILFLSWNRVLNAFEVKFGPNGVFELMPNRTVDTPGKSTFAQAQKTKATAALIADLKRVNGLRQAAAAAAA
jgi:hypothetical protein